MRTGVWTKVVHDLRESSRQLRRGRGVERREGAEGVRSANERPPGRRADPGPPARRPARSGSDVVQVVEVVVQVVLQQRAHRELRTVGPEASPVEVFGPELLDRARKL